MSDAANAYAFAQRLIEQERREQTGTLDLWLRETRGLETLPPEIADLTVLTSLHLGNTQITDLTPIANLTALTELNLWDTQVADITPVAGLKTLTSLHLMGTQVTDIEPVSNLSALTSLNLLGTQVADISPVAGLSALAALNLCYSRVTDISSIAGLSSLTSLNLTKTQVADLRPIRTLSRLGTDDAPWNDGLTFDNSLLTRLDPDLARLAQIADETARARNTLAYLNTLEDAEYDAFLARRMAAEGIATPPE
ncbi:leucine-rich repeat domain-containing protein [Alisedimentitalea sp. MJ-SS2]|uniref:leucine-rich repeat domain-containing protein n=1 Tax=Aliisedimentitalea sp. MJ-SS2 TaxID=3049795 RepID=UPI002906B7F5|nr:leucine-rich repeat domain-containing protein [Alisedimentitalea sp. MJ-SS2]MDU8929392.1 leucine-rich repeat domain-containing protein [Alisedimentitalea sp. MJ-SS2]